MDQGGGEASQKIENNVSLVVDCILVFIKARSQYSLAHLLRMSGHISFSGASLGIPAAPEIIPGIRSVRMYMMPEGVRNRLPKTLKGLFLNLFPYPIAST